MIDRWHLARHLGPDQPVYGLQPRGMDGTLPPYTRIEDMAAHYVEEIRSFLPQGPYLLAGHSFGGLVAWEVARQLHEQGREVALLALIDTRFSPSNGWAKGRCSSVEKFFFLRRADYHFGKLWELKPTEMFTYVWERVNGRINRGAYAQVPSASDSTVDSMVVSTLSPLQVSNTLEPLQQVAQANHEAERAYAPRRYSGRITIFLASQQLYLERHDSRLLFVDLADVGNRIHKVPGNHCTVVHEPHVRVLAGKLRASIDRAIASEGVGTTYSRPVPIP